MTTSSARDGDHLAASGRSAARPAPAEWWERLTARIIDGVPFVVLYYILFTTFLTAFGPSAGAPGAGGGDGGDALLPEVFAWLISGIAFAAYDVALHSRNGRTVGKSIVGIRLVTVHGDVLTRGALMKRAAILPGLMALTGIAIVNLVAGVIMFAVGLFILIDKPLQQGLHDRLAGTMVVRTPR